MEPVGGTETPEMTQEQKIIRAKVGLLELARQLGNVSQACKMLMWTAGGCNAFLVPLTVAKPLL
jgi:hypothetical protein